MNKALFLSSLVTLITLASVTAEADLPNGIASGDVTQDSVVLWTRSDAPGALSFEYSKDADFANIAGVALANVSNPLIPVKVSINNLDERTRYYYRAIDSSGSSLSGTFLTLMSLGTKTGLRFGVSGDWRGELAPYPALTNATTRDLDFFTILGDTIYADYESPALPLEQAISLNDYRIKHNEVYSSHFGMNTLADLRASTSVFVSIDDHEVANDFSGAADVSSDDRFASGPAGTLVNDSVLYNNGMQVFFEYNPILNSVYEDTGADPRMDGEFKLYRQRTMGSDALFISLDTRSFRDPGLPEVANPLDQVEVTNYLVTSLTADRTMLGARQLADLKTDLLAAQANGVTWKLIGIPEPAQNLGVIGASDRFEGYAKERAEILKFIEDNRISNVVFITADIHGTVINNLEYQELTSTGINHIATSAFEISTGSVAFDKPFGPKALELASLVPADATGMTLSDVFFSTVGVPDLLTFKSLPLALKDTALKGLIDQQIMPLGYTPVGLEDSGLDVTLLVGGYTALNTYGWTEFEIDAKTQKLLVTTYGIPAYSTTDLSDDLNNILARTPSIISQFEVTPRHAGTEQCASFNHSLLTIPCVSVSGKQYFSELSVRQNNPLQFAIANASDEFIGEPLQGCATYDTQSNIVDLPCVSVGEQQVWAKLKLIQSQPSTFKLDSYGFN